MLLRSQLDHQTVLYIDTEPVGGVNKEEMEENFHSDDALDHVVQIAGIDHVGLGSDFDGVGDSLPTGLKDVSYFPNLIRELLSRGYSDEDIEKICSGNLFRVWSEVERHAAASDS